MTDDDVVARISDVIEQAERCLCGCGHRLSPRGPSPWFLDYQHQADWDARYSQGAAPVPPTVLDERAGLATGGPVGNDRERIIVSSSAPPSSWQAGRYYIDAPVREADKVLRQQLVRRLGAALNVPEELIDVPAQAIDYHGNPVPSDGTIGDHTHQATDDDHNPLYPAATWAPPHGIDTRYADPYWPRSMRDRLMSAPPRLSLIRRIWQQICRALRPYKKESR